MEVGEKTLKSGVQQGRYGPTGSRIAALSVRNEKKRYARWCDDAFKSSSEEPSLPQDASLRTSAFRDYSNASSIDRMFLPGIASPHHRFPTPITHENPSSTPPTNISLTYRMFPNRPQAFPTSSDPSSTVAGSLLARPTSVWGFSRGTSTTPPSSETPGRFKQRI